jgi:hypothetical protein
MLPAADDARAWRWWLLALTGASAAIYSALAWFLPGTLTPDAFAIQDDARQFLSWTPRLLDAGALCGDLIADYWQSVSPPPFRALYAAPAALGVSPLVTARVLPALLLLVTALAAWPVAWRLTGGRAAAAFVCAGAVMFTAIHDDSIFSATPRALAVPLLLVFLNGLLAGRAAVMLAGLIALAAVYPAPALVALTMLGLSRIRTWWPPRPDLSRRSLLLVLAATLGVAAAVLPLKGETTRWGPTVTLAQARQMPSMAGPSGRSRIVTMDGRIGWLCSNRMGFVPAVVPCEQALVTPGALANLLLLVPMLVMGWRGVRAGDVRQVYAWAFAAAALWYAIAALVAFRLHLPSRYSGRVLAVTELLAIGQWLGLRADAALREGRGRRGVALLGVVLAASFLTPQPHVHHPRDTTALTAIARLPRDVRIAGVSDTLTYVPALTGRVVLATTEHAIPYTLGYFRPLAAGLRASVAAATTPDPAELAALLARHRIDVLAVDRAVLAGGALPRNYARVLGPLAPPAAPSAASRLADACALPGSPDLALIGARCLRAAAGRAGLRRP